MKKILCLALSLSLMICLAGCGNNSSNGESSESSQSVQNDSLNDDVSALEEDLSGLDEEISDIENETSEVEKKSGLKDNTYTSDYYTFDINDSWELTDEGSTLDCTFGFADYDDSESNERFTAFSVQTIPQPDDTSLKELAEQMVNMYNDTDNYKVESNKETKFNDNDAYEIILAYTNSDVTVKMRQTILKHDKSFFAVNSVAEKSVYDDMIKKIDEVLKTFKFI